MSNEKSDMILLLYLLFMTISGFMLEGLRLSLSSHDMLSYSFVGRFFMPSLLGINSYPEIILSLMWSIHGFSGIGIILYLPHSKLMHSILGPLVIAINAEREFDRKDIYWPKAKNFRQNS